MLINLSNHPNGLWSVEQREAAELDFEGVVDLPFPAVPPTATTKDVEVFAHSLVEECKRLAGVSNTPTSVMIAGEQTLMFKTVILLQLAGFVCYAATSERKVVQKSATEKSIEFCFVQFRAFY